MDVKKTIATLLTAVTIGTTGVIQTTKPLEPIDTIEQNEIVSQRTATAKVYDLGNGKQKAIVGMKPRHWQDGKEWKTIDTSVRERALLTALFSKYEYETASGVYNAYFDKDSDSDYGFKRDDATVDYTFLTDVTGITVETETNERGVKQNYILADSKASTELRWLIDTNATINGADANCDIVFEYEKEHAFTITAPVAWDANSQLILVSSKVSGDTLIYKAIIPKDAVYPVTVDPSTTIITNNDNSLRVLNEATYTAARDLTSAEDIESNLVKLGQSSAGAVYDVYRGYMSFAIPELVTVSACSLYLFGVGDFSATDFNLNMVGAQDYGPTLTVEDFSRFDGWQSSGAYTGTLLTDTWSTSSYIAGWNSMTFNSAGIDSVEQASSDTLRVAVLSSKDYSNTAPSGTDIVEFKGSFFSGDEPYLSMTYSVGTINEPTSFSITSPTTTQLTTSWTNNSANYDSLLVMNSPEETGVVYAASGTATTVNSTGLTPNTLYTYFVRADSSGIKGDSNTDSLYTLAEAPTNLAIAMADTNTVNITFDTGSNPDSTLYSVENDNWSVFYGADGDTTSTETWLTNTAWEAKDLTVQVGEKVTLIVKGKNGDDVETATDSESIVTGNLKKAIITPDSWVINYADTTNYEISRETTIAGLIYQDGVSYLIGQDLSDGRDKVYRISGEYTLPDMDSLTVARMRLTGIGDLSTTDFNVFVKTGYWSAAIDNGYYQWNTWQGGTTPHVGANITNAWNTSDYNGGADGDSLIFTASGIDSLELYKSGTVKLELLSSLDIDATDNNDQSVIGVQTGKLYIVYYDYDYVPSNVALNNITGETDSLVATWTDNSSTETNFAVVDSATGLVTYGTFDAGATSGRIGGLTPNTYYAIKIKVIGGKLDGEFSTDTDAAYTEAATPTSVPVLVFSANGDTLKIAAAAGSLGTGNSSFTEYAWQDSITGFYINPTATPDTIDTSGTTHWATIATWGDTIRVHLRNYIGKTLRMRAKARNGE